MPFVQFSNKQFIVVITGFNLFLAASIALSAQPLPHASNILTLAQAEQIALTDEPGLMSQQWQAKSLSERAVADGQLMDPKLQVGLNNLPTDTFDFDQENMTQFKVGIVQQFPAGDTLNIRRQKTLQQSEVMLAKMAERKLTITKDVRLTYLEIYYWEVAKKTIVKNKKLFTQLVDIVQSLFSVGRNNQHDLIRAQLELSRLDDRLTKITQTINTKRSKLSRWIGTHNSQKPLAGDLPDLKLNSGSKASSGSKTSSGSGLSSDSGLSLQEENTEILSQQFNYHPKVQEIDNKLAMSRKDIDLAKESYKPGWGLNVSYGYRDSTPNGNKRADFISAGVTIGLPLFTGNRQDKKLLSREHEYQALKDQKIELIRKLVADLQEELVNEEQLQKRYQLYQNVLLPQAKLQAQASLLAYQSDRGDFADVMRARIDELNAKLDERRIAVDYLQTRARILYFVSSFKPETIVISNNN